MIRELHDAVGPAGTQPLIVEHIGLGEITDPSNPVMDELSELYPRAYHNSKMLSDLRNDIARNPAVFTLTVARPNHTPSATEPNDAESGPIIGARLIRDTPADDAEDHFGYPAVHGSRFCVDPDLRGHGIGSVILQAGNRHAFEQLGMPAVFGGSNEVGAMRMYAKNGAMFHGPSIDAYGSSRNSPEVNRRAFSTFVMSSTLYGYRMTGGQHIRYAYPANPAISNELEELQFYPLESILAQAGIERFIKQWAQVQERAAATR